MFMGFRAAAASVLSLHALLLALACCISTATATEALMIMGPLGGGGSPKRFDDTSIAASGFNPITQIKVEYGSWIDAISVTYGAEGNATRHGGNGGSIKPTLNLTKGEYITKVSGVGGAYVDHLVFHTNKGRVWGAGNGRTDLQSVTPCPEGAYKLIAIKGVADQYLEQIYFVWAPIPGANVTASIPASNQNFTCQWGIETPFRLSANGKDPECLSLDGGKSCATSSNCQYLLRCGGGTTLRCGDAMKAATGASGYENIWHWCSRARNALSDVRSPPAQPITMLTVVLDVCDSGPAAPLAAVDTALYSHPYSLANHWTRVSFNKSRLDRTTSKVVSIRLPCDCFNKSTCQFNDWVAWVRTNLPSLYSLKWENYLIHNIMVPDNTACQDLGFWSGDTAFIRGSSVEDLNIYKHELGHGLGLSHASIPATPGVSPVDQEYGDHSSPMGFCPVCAYSAPHMLQLGWSSILRNLDGQQLPEGRVVRVVGVPALVDTPRSVVQVRLDWLGSEVPAGYLFLSYRVRKGQDGPSGPIDPTEPNKPLPDQYNHRISIHSHGGAFGEGGNPVMVDTVALNRSMALPSIRLVVAVEAADTNRSTVTVCRYRQQPTECANYKVKPSGGIPTDQQVTITTGAGKCVDIQWGSSEDGATVWQWPCNGGLAQKFVVEDAGDGYYYIKDRAGVRCVEGRAESAGAGAPSVGMWQCNFKDSQKYNITRVNGGYLMKPKSDSRLCIDVSGAKASYTTGDDSTLIQLSACSGGSISQLFDVKL